MEEGGWLDLNQAASFMRSAAKERMSKNIKIDRLEKARKADKRSAEKVCVYATVAPGRRS